MRKPRSKQRWPIGGEELYELLRMDHEPRVVYVRRADQTPTERMALHKPDILVYQAEADPMLYFWPVENLCVWAQFDHDAPYEERKRLAQAMLRDGATWIMMSWHPPEPKGFDVESWGDPLRWYTDREVAP